jgi:glyoxylase-like metal-dependent hydrolase (beta-lactamase superfamily II)
MISVSADTEGTAMAGVDVVPLVDEGLGNSAYLVDLGDGRALVVDVSRDLRAVHKAAARRKLIVAFAADTHLHADFLSGAHQLGVTCGTRVLASAAGHREFTHTGLRDGDEVDLGGLKLRALLTPGHTHEHMAFLLLDGDREVGVFSGGSLLVGSAARTDLVCPDRHRGARESPIRLAAPAGRPARACAGLAHPRRRIVLLGTTGYVVEWADATAVPCTHCPDGNWQVSFAAR